MKTFVARQPSHSQKHASMAPGPFDKPATPAIGAKQAFKRLLQFGFPSSLKSDIAAVGARLPVQPPLQLAHKKYLNPKKNPQGFTFRRLHPNPMPDVVAAADIDRVQGPLTLEQGQLPLSQRKAVVAAINRRQRPSRANRSQLVENGETQKQAKEEDATQVTSASSLAEPSQRLVPSRTPDQREKVALKTSQLMAKLYPRVAPSPITVSHREDAYGTGAFWDHYTMQKQTGRDTHVTHHPDSTPTVIPAGPAQKGKRVGHNFTGELPRGLPPSAANVEAGFGRGLLFIPGGNVGLAAEKPSPDPAHDLGKQSASAQLRHGQRMGHQQQAITDARNKGRPTLAVCGGSWCLLDSFGGSTRRVQPKTHQTRVMPYLKQDGTVAKVISHHGVTIAPKSMVGSFMRGRGKQRLPDRVNSAHWAAAEQTTDGRLKGVQSADEPRRRIKGTRFTIVGPGHPQKSLLSVSAQGHSQRDPPHMYATNESNGGHPSSVEAFETRFGAPMLGVQWHPEAYDSGSDPSEHAVNRRLLTSMAQAGDAYDARRGMTAQFQGMVDGKTRHYKSASLASSSASSSKPEPEEPLVLLSPSEVKSSAARSDSQSSTQRGPKNLMENVTPLGSSSSSSVLHTMESTARIGATSLEEEAEEDDGRRSKRTKREGDL